LIFALWSNVAAYAQNETAAANGTTSSQKSPSSQRISKVRITSPTRGQQVPVGKDLTISGTYIDNATVKCEVSVIVNNVKLYQNTTAAGGGGAADYSKCNFALTSKYTTIKPGENRITSKYECANNPDSKGFSSVNVTGVKQ
jgi:Bacterial Ig domain